MIRGETVTVIREVDGPLDPFGEPTASTTVSETVDDVLVSPGGRSDVDGSTRPDGVRIKWQLHFPKPWAGPLRGAKIVVRDDKPRPVVGDPKPYTASNTPTRWWMPVELEDIDG